MTTQKQGLKVALVGATGAVGTEFLRLFDQLTFPLDQLVPLASKASVGKRLVCLGKQWPVAELTKDSFQGIDLAFFSAGAARSLEFAPHAVKAGALVVDNSSAFRMDPKVPLVVPEVNPADIFDHQGIIANPNCSTIQMVVALKPLMDFSPIEQVRVATYQAVSGTGAKALEELTKQAKAYVQGQKIEASVYPAQILFNAIPQVDVFLEDGYTKEEMKMVLETQKIMHRPSMKISATCVRVPVMRSHSEAIWLTTEKPISVDQAKELFEKADGVKVIDRHQPGAYPMPLYAEGSFLTYVGRIRKDLVDPRGLTFWCVADQLLKGAAWNALQIGAHYFKIPLAAKDRVDLT